jgi:hypothetical protein
MGGIRRNYRDNLADLPTGVDPRSR